MKERPILFNAPMVRALLAGTKTQTRRAIKAPASVTAFSHFHADKWDRLQGSVRGDSVRCPYGQPGERLWVREAWRVAAKWDSTKPSDLQARGMTVEFEAGGYGCNGIDGSWAFRDAPVRERPEWVGKLRPGIHMPRWASRILLEVTAIRVERLQDINRGDAMAEGCPFPNMPDPRHWYRDLWNEINGASSWDANPWVWVVKFKRVQP